MAPHELTRRKDQIGVARFFLTVYEPPISGFAFGLRCCRDWLQRLDEGLIGCNTGAWQMIDAVSAVIGLGHLLCDVLAGD
jgi:hypothetical protein